MPVLFDARIEMGRMDVGDGAGEEQSDPPQPSPLFIDRWE
jgi:hypothetical protein